MKKSFIFVFAAFFLIAPTFAQWQQLNGPKCNSVNCFAIDNSYIWAGTELGCFISYVNPLYWTMHNSGLLISDYNIRSLVFNSNYIYAATYSGIFRSYNTSGWQLKISGIPVGEDSISVLTKCGINILAGNNHGKIYNSSDNGENWTQVFDGLSSPVSAFSVINNIVYAGFEGQGMIYSTDGGTNWNTINTGTLGNATVNAIACVESAVYVATTNGLYNLTFDTVWNTESLNLSVAINAFAVYNTKLFAATSELGILISEDNGNTWAISNNGISVSDIKSLSVYGNVILAGCSDGLVFKSSTLVINWQETSVGLLNFNISTFSVSGSVLFAGTNNYGIYESSNEGLDWQGCFKGLDQFNIKTLTSNTNVVFAGTYGGGIYRSSINGINWEETNSGLTNLYVNTIVCVDSMIFAGTYGGGIYKSVNNGLSWVQVNNGLTNFNFNSLAVLGQIVFAGGQDGIFFSSNYGVSWSAVNSGLGNMSVSTFIIKDTVLFAGTHGSGIYKFSSDLQSWSPVNTGLPQYSYVYSLASDGSNIYAGLSAGEIYYSANNGGAWVLANTGIVNSDMVSALIVFSGRIFAGIYNSGIWSRPLSEFNAPLLFTAVGSSGISCFNANDGIATATVFGGISPYSFQWSNDATTQIISDLEPGIYWLTVTDSFNSVIIVGTEVEEPGELVVNYNLQPVLCNGWSSTVEISASGGIPPYSGTGVFLCTSGEHSYTITDATGCTNVLSFIMSEPPVLDVSVNYMEIMCNGQSTNVSVVANGGTPPFYGVGDFSFTAGEYVLNISDANGCEVNYEIALLEPPPIYSEIFISNNGNGFSQANLLVSGGIPPYSFYWSTGYTTEDAANLVCGIFFVTITDSSDCQKFDSVVITHDINEADLKYTYWLYQNFPNPFNENTEICFYLPVKTFADLTVYNILGEKVGTLLSGELPPGEYRIVFRNNNYPAGTYFYKLKTPDFTGSNMMQMIKSF